MGFLSKFFAKSDPPELAPTDATLGVMKWSEENEGWLGHYNGFDFIISSNQTNSPDEGVLAYAREVLNEPAWLASTLAEAKTRHKNELSEKMRRFYEAEIDGLNWGTIYFDKHRGKRRIFATLEPGKDYRCWRIEYADRTCEGMGFDS